MLILIIFFLIPEILSVIVLRQHFIPDSRIKYSFFLVLHTILSIIFWILFFSLASHESFFDTPGNIWNLTAFTGMIFAVIVPRYILVILHFSGRFRNRKKAGHIRWLTNVALIILLISLLTAGLGAFHGRFNFKYEEVTIPVKDLHGDLAGLRIVQISDLHIAGFYHHPDKLAAVIKKIGEYNPDLLINTGDFITFGWREFGRNDTILSAAKGKYGAFAVQGNHDAGTYHPEYTKADIKNSVAALNNLVEASGYTMLNDEHRRLNIGDAEVVVIGVTAAGSHPDIVHGNIGKAAEGTGRADLKILLTHDPNHWIEQVAGKWPDIQLTLSGHTHGMQMGILTKRFKWSPSKFFYPNWNGIYYEGNQVQYVNRGLGVLGIPFRFWMPPEITVITLMPG
jgi:uncharacterized protein